MPTYTFTPPESDGELVGDPREPSWRLHRFYGSWAQGKTVWKDQSGVWHESDQPYLGGDTHTVHNNTSGTTTITAPAAGLATAQKVFDGGHVHEGLTFPEAIELIAAGYGDRINVADQTVYWTPTEASKLSTKWLFSSDGAAASGTPTVENSQVVHRLVSGTPGATNLREALELDGTRGWEDVEVYCDGLNPPAFGVGIGTGGVNVLPQIGVALRLFSDGVHNYCISLNNNVFGGVPMLNIGVWQGTVDGSVFQHRSAGFGLPSALPFPYGLHARLVGNVITVTIFPSGKTPDPNNPLYTMTVDLDVDPPGDPELIPTPTSGACGFISAHLGTDPLCAMRIGKTEFRRIT